MKTVQIKTAKKAQSLMTPGSTAKIEIFNLFQQEEQFGSKTISKDSFVNAVKRGVKELDEMISLAKKPLKRVHGGEFGETIYFIDDIMHSSLADCKKTEKNLVAKQKKLMSFIK